MLESGDDPLSDDLEPSTYCLENFCQFLKLLMPGGIKKVAHT